ncbi:MAG TPA: hypothetical protein VFB78_02690 [Acidimicrobiales bacterium]|nr:hypothetical protein [Acidimicrobiales bacterium]
MDLRHAVAMAILFLAFALAAACIAAAVLRTTVHYRRSQRVKLSGGSES